MLKIFNDLKPFIEDCYREIGVREYSRIMKITPPTSSKLLKDFEKENLLEKRIDRGYLLFRANRESKMLEGLSKLYWKQKLKKIIEDLNHTFYSPTIILFGSLNKLESKENSDIDIAILTDFKKKINLEKYEKIFKRKIQIFVFESLKKIPKDLKKNIINGYLFSGEFK